jgi:hypothetical protein
MEPQALRLALRNKAIYSAAQIILLATNKETHPCSYDTQLLPHWSSA